MIPCICQSFSCTIWTNGLLDVSFDVKPGSVLGLFNAKHWSPNSAKKMSRISVHRKVFGYWIFISTNLILSKIFHARVDASLERNDDGKTFLEHLNFVLNVRPYASITTHDSLSCAMQCHTRKSCLSFNFAILEGNDNCELQHSDKYISPDRFQASLWYHHYSIMVSQIMLAEESNPPISAKIIWINFRPNARVKRQFSWKIAGNEVSRKWLITHVLTGLWILLCRVPHRSCPNSSRMDCKRQPTSSFHIISLTFS